MTIEHIKKEFPNLKYKELNANTGCNIYLPGKLIVTIFFKRKIFKTNEVKKYRRFSDDEDMIKIICAFGNIKLKQSSNITLPKAVELIGTKACIDHIKIKIATIEKVKSDNAVLMILKQLTLELEQYL